MDFTSITLKSLDRVRGPRSKASSIGIAKAIMAKARKSKTNQARSTMPYARGDRAVDTKLVFHPAEVFKGHSQLYPTPRTRARQRHLGRGGILHTEFLAGEDDETEPRNEIRDGWTIVPVFGNFRGGEVVVLKLNKRIPVELWKERECGMRHMEESGCCHSFVRYLTV